MAKLYTTALLDTVSEVKESLNDLAELEAFKVSAKTTTLEITEALESLDVAKLNIDSEISKLSGLTSAQFTEQNVRLSEGIRSRYWTVVKAVAKSELKDKDLSAALSKVQVAFFESIIPIEDVPEVGHTLTNAKGATPVEGALRKGKNNDGAVKWAGWLKTRSAWNACSQLNLHIKKLGASGVAPKGRILSKKVADELVRPAKGTTTAKSGKPMTPAENVTASIETLKKRLLHKDLSPADATRLIGEVTVMLSTVAVELAKREQDTTKK